MPRSMIPIVTLVAAVSLTVGCAVRAGDTGRVVAAGPSLAASVSRDSTGPRSGPVADRARADTVRAAYQGAGKASFGGGAPLGATEGVTRSGRTAIHVPGPDAREPASRRSRPSPAPAPGRDTVPVPSGRLDAPGDSLRTLTAGLEVGGGDGNVAGGVGVVAWEVVDRMTGRRSMGTVVGGVTGGILGVVLSLVVAAVIATIRALRRMDLRR